MKTLKQLIFVLFFGPAIFLISCGPDIYEQVYPTLGDGKYDSEFPYRNSSKQLEEISNTLKLVNSLAFYKSYIFSDSSVIRKSDLSDDIIDKYTIRNEFFNQTESGTSTVIYSESGKVALLTCAHIINFPDTLISFFSDENGELSPYIQSISIKVKQTNYINLKVQVVELDIIAKDDNLDVALIGGKFDPEYTKDLKLFNYPVGKAKELEWGSFVYVFGYPLNNKMITKGIVSSPDKDKKGSFLVDAIFNRGFSGGIVLAVRDGVPNFELVGLVRSVPVESRYVLAPAELKTNAEYNRRIPFTGEVFVEKQININYGITNVLSIEAIEEFLENNKTDLEAKGYYIDKFKINGKIK